MNCEEKSRFCDGLEVKMVRMKSNKGGITRGNVYEGKVLAMCKGCRSSQNGQFKYVK